MINNQDTKPNEIFSTIRSSIEISFFGGSFRCDEQEYDMYLYIASMFIKYSFLQKAEITEKHRSTCCHSAPSVVFEGNSFFFLDEHV